MAKIIVDFEARRDAQGRLVVYTLRPEDGGGRYEVAGINERYHKAVCDELVDLIRRGRYDDAETRAAEFVASYTDRAQAWTQNPGLEFFLRDTMFNRGPGGAAWVLQKALGVAIDRDVGGETLAALRAAEGRPHDLLDRMRAAREAYERLNRDETSIFWRGLVNRWNKARQAAQIFMQASEGETPIETAALRAGVDEAIALAPAGGTDEGPDRLRQQRDTDLHERLRSRREREALSDEGEPNLDLAGAGENLTVRASLIENNDDLALERVLGHSDLLPIHWLQRGLNVARSVCRVAVRDQAGVTLGYGTGSMIAPDLMLTNNHVLSSPEAAQNSLIEFDFEEGIAGPQKPVSAFRIDPTRAFVTSPMRDPANPGAALDYTIVAVDSTPLQGKALAEFGVLGLIEERGKVVNGESVTIIQHPKGGLKKIAARENQVVDKLDQYVLYVTDTEPGSSGSPVFNDQWIVVALHHAGVEADDPRLVGRPAAALPSNSDSEGRRWIANEGIRISSIFADIRARAAAKEPGAMAVAERLNIVPAGPDQEAASPSKESKRSEQDRLERREEAYGVPFEVLDAYERQAEYTIFDGDRSQGAAAIFRPESTEAGIAFGPNARARDVTALSQQVLHDIMGRAGISTLTISSTSRGPADQARVMFDNLEHFGVAHQKALYGPSGDRVIDVYALAKHAGKDAAAIKSLMTAEIIQVGPTNVSRHASDPRVLNVFDVAPGSVSPPEAFEAAVRAERRVSKFITPPSDPGYHLEIPQT